jgi:hypothetical protein
MTGALFQSQIGQQRALPVGYRAAPNIKEAEYDRI